MAATEDFNIGKKEKKSYDMIWKEETIILIFFILILTGLTFSPVLFKNQVKASSLQTSVVIYICGNGIIEEPEICDDGSSNGRYAYNTADKFCNLTCDGWAPYCGDGILQSNYGEECDDGNNVSGDGCDPVCKTEAPSPPPSSGGGGGWIPPRTKVVIKGKAYPQAQLTLLQDGKVIATEKADDLANFKIEIKDITPGVWTFSLWAKDKKGRKSITLSYTVTIQRNMITTISGVFLPPTIELSRVNLKKGEELDISGQTVPQSQIFTHIESSELIKTATSTKKGDWQVEIDTGILEEGTHTTRAKAKTFDGLKSSFSQVLAFYVGEKAPEIVRSADLNRDDKVNLIDFSILLYWWGKENPSVDLNQDGLVNLSDFSIMLYYWTG